MKASAGPGEVVLGILVCHLPMGDAVLWPRFSCPHRCSLSPGRVWGEMGRGSWRSGCRLGFMGTKVYSFWLQFCAVQWPSQGGGVWVCAPWVAPQPGETGLSAWIPRNPLLPPFFCVQLRWCGGSPRGSAAQDGPRPPHPCPPLPAGPHPTMPAKKAASAKPKVAKKAAKPKAVKKAKAAPKKAKKAAKPKAAKKAAKA